jgi:hypothetical protein
VPTSAERTLPALIFSKGKPIATCPEEIQRLYTTALEKGVVAGPLVEH